jgi:serine/threonine protein kinase
MIAANSIIGGRYRVIKPVGGGGMKLVYLAEDMRLASRSCALAEMVDSFTDPAMQKQAVAAFQREADMLAQLSNEHIPRVFDRFSEQNRHYLVMEYVDGITLEDELKKSGGKLPESRVIDIALQILDTLQYLHNLSPSVVYRDLKPSNVMITRNGQIKLIDFGIARFFLPQSNATMIGTQGYAPPEQYRGRAESRSDLYALGATMHHALSGRDPALEPPFSFPKLKTLCPDINSALADLVDQALEYDVVHRMADAAEFKERLLAIKSGAPYSSAANGQTGTRAKERSQPRINPREPAAQATPDSATIMLRTDDTRCASCRRMIPADSRFCSFCGADLTHAVVTNPGVDPDSMTTVLNERDAITPASERSDSVDRHPNWRPATRRDPRARRFIIALVAGLIVVAISVNALINRMVERPAEPSYPSEPGVVPPEASIPPGLENPRPDTPEPMHNTPMAATLREWLNVQGYDSVRFSLNGSTVILWGTVPNEFERRWVRTQATMLTGATAVIDHMVIGADPSASSE